MEHSNQVISALMKWQISLLLLVLLTSCSARSTYYVTSTPDTPCPGEPCHTLSQYVANQNFKNLLASTTMKFLPGNHTLNQTISVTNLTWLSLLGDSSSLPEVTSRIVCTWPAGFVFTGITELYISSLAFISCGHNDSAAVNIISIQQSNISNCSFHSNVNADSYCYGSGYNYDRISDYDVHTGGALYIQSSNVILAVNKFQYNSAGKGGAVYMDKSNSIITGTIFEYNSVVHYRRTFFDYSADGSGGALYVNSSTLKLTNRVTLLTIVEEYFMHGLAILVSQGVCFKTTWLTAWKEEECFM